MPNHVPKKHRITVRGEKREPVDAHKLARALIDLQRHLDQQAKEQRNASKPDEPAA